MMELMTWPRNTGSIFDELEALNRDVNGVMRRRGRGQGTGRARQRAAYPPMDVWSTEEGVAIEAELPGVDPKDVDISVDGDELTLKGEVKAREAAEGETIHWRERGAGEFSRTLQLSFKPDSAGVKATYRNGILRLTVPRAETDKPRKIEIEA